MYLPLHSSPKGINEATPMELAGLLADDVTKMVNDNANGDSIGLALGSIESLYQLGHQPEQQRAPVTDPGTTSTSATKETLVRKWSGDSDFVSRKK